MESITLKGGWRGGVWGTFWAWLAYQKGWGSGGMVFGENTGGLGGGERGKMYCDRRGGFVILQVGRGGSMNPRKSGGGGKGGGGTEAPVEGVGKVWCWV